MDAHICGGATVYLCLGDDYVLSWCKERQGKLFAAMIVRSDNELTTIQRLESSAKSPIFEQFGSVLSGIGTIRAFDKTDAYIERYLPIDVLH